MDVIAIRDLTSPEIQEVCITITEPTEIQISGGVTVVVMRDGVRITTLSAQKTTHKLFTPDEYCFFLSGKCVEGVLSSGVIAGGSGGSGGSGSDTERNVLGCIVDGLGNVTGRVYLTTEYDVDGNPIGDVIISVSLIDGTITRPYAGPISSDCPPLSPRTCCFDYEQCADLNGEEVVVRVFEVRDETLAVVSQRYETADGTDVTATATLVQCGTCQEDITACLTFQGFDYYEIGGFGGGDTTTFEVLVDGVVVATDVIDYIAADTGTKSSWYAALVASVAGNSNWTMTPHTDPLSTADGARVIWNLQYSGPGGEQLEIRSVEGGQSHIFGIDAAGVMTNSVISSGIPSADFITAQFDQVACNV